MAGEIIDYVFVTNKAGLEDVDFGYGQSQQIRDGEIVNITRVNAHNIPYAVGSTGEVTTIGEILDILIQEADNA